MGKLTSEETLKVEYAKAYQELVKKQSLEITKLREDYQSQGVSVLMIEKAIEEVKSEERKRKLNRGYTKKWQEKKDVNERS